MERVRPWWSPPVPGISWFLETNLRTYVRHQNGDSGVWFFSLDANHRLFAQSPSGDFYSGLVHHKPYTFAETTVAGFQQTLTATIDCPVNDTSMPDHVAYSPGVDVSVSPIQRIS